MIVSSTRILVEFGPEHRRHPLRLLAVIGSRVYAEILLLSILGVAVLSGVTALALWQHHYQGHLSSWVQTLIWLCIFFPLVVSLEEFFHAAACIGRGKFDRVQGLIIGRYYVGVKYFLFQFVAISMRGKFNHIDRFYISSAGPLLAIGTVIVVYLSSGLASTAAPMRTALLILALVPMIGLLPQRVVVSSDGYNIRDAAMRLRMPFGAVVFEIARSTLFALRWILFPSRDYSDDFTHVSLTHEDIAKAVAAGDIVGAVALYRRLEKTDPYNPLVQNNLAWLLADLGQLREAERHARKALTLGRQDPEILDTLVRIQNARRQAPDPSR